MFKLKECKWWAIAFIYAGFFTLLGVAVYITGSGLPLWALLISSELISIED